MQCRVVHVIRDDKFWSHLIRLVEIRSILPDVTP